MLYKIAHFLRDKLPFFWDLIDILNSCLFLLRYGQKLKSIEGTVLHQYAEMSGMDVVIYADSAQPATVMGSS